MERRSKEEGIERKNTRETRGQEIYDKLFKC